MSDPKDTPRPEHPARGEGDPSTNDVDEGGTTKPETDPGPDTERPASEHLERATEVGPPDADEATIVGTAAEEQPTYTDPPTTDPEREAGGDAEPEPAIGAPTTPPEWASDSEATVNLSGDMLSDFPLRDDLADRATDPPDAPMPTPWEPGEEDTDSGLPGEDTSPAATDVARSHLKGLLEALIFVSEKPIKTPELAKAASASAKELKLILAELRTEYADRGVQLDEVAGGWIFRTNPAFAPFIRDLTKQKPVRLSRAQLETLAIMAYRQPITRPEIDEIRGVDCGATLKLLLERDLVRILGKKDEPGRPLVYGTTTAFLEFFGLKSLKDLPTLREFTELNEDSRLVVERELGEELEARQPEPAPAGESPDVSRDTLPPDPIAEGDEERPTEDPEPVIGSATEEVERVVSLDDTGGDEEPFDEREEAEEEPAEEEPAEEDPSEEENAEKQEDEEEPPPQA